MEFVEAISKPFVHPTRERGMSLELLRSQSLAHASGFQMLCNCGSEMPSRSYARQSVVFPPSGDAGYLSTIQP
jgi:hypothetical protein